MDTKIDDELVPAISLVCAFCARLDINRVRRCKAFGAEEIPLEIWGGSNDHHLPYPGDHGKQFIRWDEESAKP